MSLNHASKNTELTDEHFKSIGKIMVEWSNIEFLLGQLLAKLLLTPIYLSRSYTDNLGASRIQDTIIEAVSIHKQRYGSTIIDESKLNEILNINSKVVELRAKRNKFAHFCWMIGTDDEIFGTNFSGGAPDSKKGRRSSVTYSNVELESSYMEAYDLVEELSKILNSLPEMKEEGIKSKLSGCE